MIKKLSAERGKLIHAHESSAKPRKAHISYTFGATGTSETKPKTIKNPKEPLKTPKIFRLRRYGTFETDETSGRFTSSAADPPPPPDPTPPSAVTLRRFPR